MLKKVQSKKILKIQKAFKVKKMKFQKIYFDKKKTKLNKRGIGGNDHLQP